MPSGGDKREAILENIKETLEGNEAGARPAGFTTGHTFVYTPDRVRRVDAIGERLLDGTKDVLFFVSDGDEGNTEGVQFTWDAEFEVFVIGFKKYEQPEDPEYQTTLRSTYHNDLIHDIKLSLGADDTRGGLVDNTVFSNFRVDIAEFRSWAFVEARLLIHYSWQRGEP